MQQLLSIVIPVYNEEAVLDELYRRTCDALSPLELRVELIFVDDGSEDGTAGKLALLREADSRIAIVELSRNFGKEVALTAGMDHAAGDAVIVMDADLQDPPELIGDFVAEWRNGYDVVYGRRLSRSGETWLKINSAKWFYRVINRLSDVEIPTDTGDFRLLSRRAVDALSTLREKHRYMKGLYAWVGYPQKAIEYHRDPRIAGNTKWNYWRLWNFALEGITSFSAVPLKLATYLGIVTSFAAFLYAAYFLVRTLIFGNPIPGYPSLIVIILFLGGVQLICLGIIGEYLGRTYGEIKGRALYFLKGYHPSASGLDDASDEAERLSDK